MYVSLNEDQTNSFWKTTLKRRKEGRPFKFETIELLCEKICEYFEWSDKNPLAMEQFEFHMGIDVRATVYKKRAYTQAALCAFIGISRVSWFKWREGENDKNMPGLSELIQWADAVIFEQKFTGAASGFFNPSIITRDLGLVDKQDIKTTTTTVVIEGNDAEL